MSTAILLLLGSCTDAAFKDEDLEHAADELVNEARKLPPGERRTALLVQAEDTYSGLGTVLGSRIDEDQWRCLWKRGEVLLELDPMRLRRFFEVMDERGRSPVWDAGRWGYREKFEVLRQRLNSQR